MDSEMESIQAIVNELADLDPQIPSEIDGDPSCYFCHKDPPEHDADCLWKRARDLLRKW